MDLKDYMESFANLHAARVKGHKAPHKAILLLSIIDLIESKIIRYPQIELSDELVSKFNVVWNRYLGESSIFSRDITKPYLHIPAHTRSEFRGCSQQPKGPTMPLFDIR